MTKKSKPSFIALSFMALLIFGGLATSAQTTSQGSGHEEHHPEAGSTEMKGEKSNMMEKMDMNQMQGMMHECMEMHKDGKMCEHQTMEQCQAKMGKGDCQKMMKSIKKEDKKAKSKK